MRQVNHAKHIERMSGERIREVSPSGEQDKVEVVQVIECIDEWAGRHATNIAAHVEERSSESRMPGDNSAFYPGSELVHPAEKGAVAKQEPARPAHDWNRIW